MDCKSGLVLDVCVCFDCGLRKCEYMLILVCTIESCRKSIRDGKLISTFRICFCFLKVRTRIKTFYIVDSLLQKSNNNSIMNNI